MYYFAYGSNMSHAQMQQRCPSSKFIKHAILCGYRFVFDGYSRKWNGSVANVIESPDEVVWGGIFEINKDNLAALDCYEGYPESYDRKLATVRDGEGNEIEAILYCRAPKKIGRPASDYLNIIIEGANDCGLPEEYIDNLRKEALKENSNDS